MIAIYSRFILVYNVIIAGDALGEIKVVTAALVALAALAAFEKMVTRRNIVFWDEFNRVYNDTIFFKEF